MVDSRGYARPQLKGRVIPDLFGNRFEGDELIVFNARRNDMKDPTDGRCGVITVIPHLHSRNGRGPGAQNRDVVSDNHGDRRIGRNVTDRQPGRSKGEKRERRITHGLVNQCGKAYCLGAAESGWIGMVGMKWVQ